jgi:MarR family transcriptional regulator, organic hydroperoxide resistance regulator
MYLLCNGAPGARTRFSRIDRLVSIIEFVSNLFFLSCKRIRSRWAMGASSKRSVGPPGPTKRASSGGTATKNQDVIRRLTWLVASIGVHLEELRYFWGKALGISGPQWLILMALAEIDQDDGVPVNVVSKKLHVDPSFITTQSKLLEKKGFIRRKTSTEDARIVLMSLTDRTYKHLASLASQQEALNEFIFAAFDERELGELTDRLAVLQARLEKACLKVVLDI